MTDLQAAGTELATGPGVHAPRYPAIRAIQVRASANEWVRLRPLRTAPSMFITSTLLYLAGFPRERIAVIVTIQLGLFVYQFVDSVRARRTGVHERALFISHLVLICFHAVSMSLTGGLNSPLWPGIIGATLGTLSLFGKSRESNVTAAVTVGLVLGIALLPAEVLGPPIPRPYNVMLAAWAILFTLFLLRTSTFALSDSYRQTGEELDKAREDVIVAAEARARSLECIGAKVAHELKNPLSAVKGLVQLLERGAADERSRERLAVIGAEVSRMEVILRDYLSFSRPLEDLRTQQVDLATIADDVLAVLEARAENAGVSIRRTGERAVASGDPRRLKEALLNLIANALEATPRGGSVEVAITAGRDGATLVIKDTGRGMNTEDLARVGTPFFTTREGGNGLGVVLARSVIRQHGGEVAYASEPGRGTMVTLRLPSRSSAPTEAEAPAPESRPEEARVHG